MLSRSRCQPDSDRARLEEPARDVHRRAEEPRHGVGVLHHQDGAAPPRDLPVRDGGRAERDGGARAGERRRQQSVGGEQRHRERAAQRVAAREQGRVVAQVEAQHLAEHGVVADGRQEARVELVGAPCRSGQAHASRNQSAAALGAAEHDVEFAASVGGGHKPLRTGSTLRPAGARTSCLLRAKLQQLQPVRQAAAADLSLRPFRTRAPTSARHAAAIRGVRVARARGRREGAVAIERGSGSPAAPSRAVPAVAAPSTMCGSAARRPPHHDELMAREFLLRRDADASRRRGAGAGRERTRCRAAVAGRCFRDRALLRDLDAAYVLRGRRPRGVRRALPRARPQIRQRAGVGAPSVAARGASHNTLLLRRHVWAAWRAAGRGLPREPLCGRRRRILRRLARGDGAADRRRQGRAETRGARNRRALLARLLVLRAARALAARARRATRSTCTCTTARSSPTSRCHSPN